MLLTDAMLIITFTHLSVCNTPYLLRSYPNDSTVTQSPYSNGPCLDPIKTLSFLQGADDASLDHTECVYNSDELLLTCKLGLNSLNSSLNLDNYPLDQIHVLILFVQEFPEEKVKSRVLDLCFLQRFGESLQELAICGYKPPITQASSYSYLHIVDIPALAIVASTIRTLLISSMRQILFHK